MKRQIPPFHLIFRMVTNALTYTDTERHRQRDRQTDRQIDRDRDRQTDYFIVRPPACNNRSEHSGNSNLYEFSDGLKLCFLIFKVFENEVDNFSTVGAFVLANNKDNLNEDGCLWYFGGKG